MMSSKFHRSYEQLGLEPIVSSLITEGQNAAGYSRLHPLTHLPSPPPLPTFRARTSLTSLTTCLAS